MIRNYKELQAWLRINAHYGKNMPENTPEEPLVEAMYTYASSLFCDDLMKDAYKVAELDYEETQVPPQKVQDILRAMWDLPKHQVLRKICEEKARRVILRVPEDVQDIDYVSAYPVSPDGWIYCYKCKGEHAPPVCFIYASRENCHLCKCDSCGLEAYSGDKLNHMTVKMFADPEFCKCGGRFFVTCPPECVGASGVSRGRSLLCMTCNTGRAGIDTPDAFKNWILGHHNQGHKVIEYIGEEKTIPAEVEAVMMFTEFGRLIYLTKPDTTCKFMLNTGQCAKPVGHAGVHSCIKDWSTVSTIKTVIEHTCNGNGLNPDCDGCIWNIKQLSDTVIGVWLPPGEVLWGFDECVHPKCGVNQCANARNARAFHCSCGTWYVRPEESKRKQYINSIYGNAKAKVLAQSSYSSIAEELAAEPKKARDFYEQALESLNTKLIQDCIWRLEESGKLEYAKHLRGYLDGLQRNGLQVGHWQNANTWGYSCQSCRRSATHSHSLDRALCIPTHEDSRVCLVSHARPDMKDRPGEFETGTWVSPGTWKYSCACGSFGGVDVQEQFCHCSKCYKLFARPDMKDKPV